MPLIHTAYCLSRRLLIKILVAGAGAIGCLVGGSLASIGCDVTLWGRHSWVSTISANGLNLQWPDGRHETVHPQAVEDLDSLTSLEAIDLVLVTPKSYATEAIAADMVGRLSPKTRVFSLQNGVGNEAVLASTLPDQSILAGSITLPVMIPEVGTIIVSKEKGGIGLAPFTEGAEIGDIAQLLQKAGFTVMTATDHRSLKWSKLIMNLIGNASSAILDMPPSQSFAHQAIFDLEIAALREALAVMRAQGISVMAFPDYPLTLLAGALRWLPKIILHPILRSAMIGGRGDKLPSLQLDLQQGRLESEVDVLNGVVVTYGTKLGVAVPVNRGLTGILNGIVDGQIPWNRFQGNPQALLKAIYEV